MRRFPWLLLVLATAVVLSAAVVRAENEGQEDLDQATEKKLSANSLDDLTQVIDLCDSALKKGLDDANTQFANNLLTSTLMQRANFIAKVIVERIPQNWPNLRQMALDDLDKALKIHPDLPAGQLLVARLQMLPGGDRAAAVKAAQQAAELAKDDPAVQVEALVLQAKIVPEPEKIEELLNQALKIAPHNDEVLVYRGRLFLEQGKADEALTDLTAAAKANPENFEAQEALGQVQFALGHNDEALKAYDEAIKLNPDAASPCVYKARVHLQAGQLDDAIADVNEALKLDPKNVAAVALRAMIHQKQGDTKAAEADVAEIFKDAGELSPAMRILISAGSGGLKQTAADLEALLEISRKNPQLSTELGMLYALRKQPHKAIDKYSAALEEDPQLFLALRGRADSYLSIGKHADAVADYNAGAQTKTQRSGRPEQSGLGAGHVARRFCARRQTGRRTCHRSRQGDRKQTGPYPEHVGGRLRGSGRFRQGRRMVQKSGAVGQRRPGDQRTAQARIGQLRREKTLARKARNERCRGLAQISPSFLGREERVSSLRRRIPRGPPNSFAHTVAAWAAYCSVHASRSACPLRWQKSPNVSPLCRALLKYTKSGANVGTTASAGTMSL